MTHPSVVNQDEKWTEEKNARRIALIERKHASGLQANEHIELAALQDEMLRFRRTVAPLPLEESRKLYQELLAQAAALNILSNEPE